MFKKLFSKKKESQIEKEKPYEKDIRTFDSSFIPNEKLTSEIQDLIGMKYLNPYKTSEADYYLDFIVDVSPFTKNFREVEDTLRKYAISLYNKEEYEISKRLFEYMVKMGTKLSINSDYLLKMYDPEKDKDKVEWIINNLKEQLNDVKDYHHEKKKVKRVLEKYV